MYIEGMYRMSNLLFIDEDILLDTTKWVENREVFQKAITEYIENNYSDDAYVYNLFTPAQRKLLDAYYKGFSREMYRELNGTVALQIQQRNENVKRKLQKLGDNFGVQIDSASWEYDGMRDVGKGASVKCDLCPHPIRYVHYAVNKQTHECLQFGCNCAADFFAMDKGRLQSMHSIQANMLRDIKIIACVKDMHLESSYYKYACGNFGKVYLEQGVQGLKELVSFKVFWFDKEHIQGNETTDTYNIQYGDGTTAQKSLEWIKQHIVHCVNADLDDYSYKALSERKIIPLKDKDITERQKNTAQYILYAISFINAGLPVPPSIAKQVNAIVTSATKQHHPDYIKYAQELLMHKNLAKSSLLRTAFTDFIVDYLASTVRKTDRDPETACWGIKGPKTFYNTVLDWEAALTKLLLMAECDALVKRGYITEAERRRYWRLPHNIRFTNWAGTYATVVNYIALCQTMFLNNKPVTRDVTNLRRGLSKYTVKDVQADLVVDSSLYNGDKDVICVADAAYKIALSFVTYQNGFKALVQNTIVTVCKILEGLSLTETDEELVKYLYSVNTRADSVYSSTLRSAEQGILTTTSYSTVKPATVQLAIKQFYDSKYDANVKDLLDKYATIIPEFRKACKALYNDLITLNNSLRGLRYVNVKKTDINNDYEALMSEDRSKNKTSIDYFKDYCNTLIGIRGESKVQQYLYSNTFMCFLAYKKMKAYTEMLTAINTDIVGQTYKQAEAQLYKTLNYQEAKKVLSTVVVLDNVEPFAQFILTEWLLMPNVYIEYKTLFSKMFTDAVKANKGVLFYSKNLYGNFETKFIKQPADEMYQPGVLDKLLPVIENDCATLLTGIKQVYTIFKPNLTVQELIKATGHESTYNKEALAAALTTQDIINAIDKTIVPFDASVTRFRAYLKQLSYFPCIADKLDTIFEKLEQYMCEHGTDIKASVETFEQETKQAFESSQNISRLKELLAEHIKFFEVDITAALKRKYHTTKEAAIRRREAFKSVKFETGLSELQHYMQELNAWGVQNATDDIKEYIKQVEELLKTSADEVDKQQLRALTYTMRAYLYNKKLIYNHYDITYKVLKEFAELDFTKVTATDIANAIKILSVYYLCASDVKKLYEYILKYIGNSDIDYESEVQQIPTVDEIDITEVYKSYNGEPDSTGLTGVQKAELVYKHADYNTQLDDFEKKVVKTVHTTQTCSSKQLRYINNAYAKLFGVTVDANNDGAEGTNANTEVDEQVLANVELAVEVMQHPKFETLPTTLQSIVTTVANTKKTKASCSSKQLYYIKRAKAILDKS
jgi:hypothetical protein